MRRGFTGWIREEVLETYAIGDFMKPIGDWRPQNGTFSVEEVK